MLRNLEHKLGHYFNIMAFIRTIICVAFFAFAVGSCASPPTVYSHEYWLEHKEHFAEGQDISDCHWCIEYKKMIP